MATIWTFGDSLTERFNPKYEWSKEYINWKGYQPKVYGNFVSELLNYDLQNLGKAGCDNYTILQTFCNTYPLIKDGDVVIIGWTFVGRFRCVSDEGKWVTLNPNYTNYLDNLNFISKNTIDEIFVNRTNYNYIEEVNSWISFINSACVNKKIIHWDTVKGDGELNTHHFFEMEKIATETNGEINDLHFSENGHQQIGLKLLDIIFNKDGITNTNKLI
jgi:hypothetical protein